MNLELIENSLGFIALFLATGFLVLIVLKKHLPMVKDFMFSSGYNEICAKYSLMHKIKHM